MPSGSKPRKGNRPRPRTPNERADPDARGLDAEELRRALGPALASLLHIAQRWSEAIEPKQSPSALEAACRRYLKEFCRHAGENKIANLPLVSGEGPNVATVGDLRHHDHLLQAISILRMYRRDLKEHGTARGAASPSAAPDPERVAIARLAIALSTADGSVRPQQVEVAWADLRKRRSMGKDLVAEYGGPVSAARVLLSKLGLSSDGHLGAIKTIFEKAPRGVVRRSKSSGESGTEMLSGWLYPERYLGDVLSDIGWLLGQLGFPEENVTRALRALAPKPRKRGLTDLQRASRASRVGAKKIGAIADESTK